jgi:hypothetical protein
MATKDPVKSEKQEPSVMVRNESVQPLGYRMAQFEAIVPAQLSPNKVLDPMTWVHISGKFQPYCHIHVLWADGSKYILIMCTHLNGAASRFVALSELRELEHLVGAAINVREDMTIQERGPLKWCVIDSDSGDILKDMCATQAEAIIWRDDARRARVSTK